VRILFLNYEYPPLGGGAANATRYLLEAWANQDDLHIDLVCASPDMRSIERFSSNIAIHRLDIGKRGSMHYQSQADLLRYARAAYGHSRGLLRATPYDGCLAFFGIPCGVVASRLGLPYIVSLRGSDVPFYNPRFRWLDRLVFQHLSRRVWAGAEAVVANSAGLRELALQTAPQQMIQVFPNGVDIERFAPARKPAEESGLRLLCVSRLIPRKGIDDLLRALALLDSRVYLDIAGGGKQEQELRALCTSLGLDSRVRFLGIVPHEDLPARYQAADLFVLPSHNEGMSNTVLEALASGLPLLLTPTGGTAELLEPGVNGSLIQPGNPASIAAAVSQYLKEPEQIAAQGAASRAKAMLFSWDAVAKAYANLMRERFAR